MAQKSNPVSTRFLGTNLWKSVWNSETSARPIYFLKLWTSCYLIKRFYYKQGFEILNIRTERVAENLVFFLSVCKNFQEKSLKLKNVVGYNSIEKENKFYPHFIKTLPRAVPLQKLRQVSNNWSHLNLGRYNSKSKSMVFQQFITKYNAHEFSILINLLYTICERPIVIVKSHPNLVLDLMPSAEYISVYIRQQLLFSIKKKRRVIPLRYFRQISTYLMNRFSGYLRGIRLQIKGRLPKLGGSAGAARSKKQLLSMGYLSTQRLLSPIDFNYVDLGSKSGICSLSVWISYRSPLSEIK